MTDTARGDLAVAPGVLTTVSDVAETLSGLVGRRAPSVGTGHRRTQRLCQRLGLDPTVVPTIHVTGTNGKTSTVRMVDAVLRAAGLSTMRFTSPHLERVGERIAIDGRSLSDDDVVACWRRLAPAVEAIEAGGTPLGFFDVLTTLFWDLAAQHQPDVAVVEVGRGGRDDATNVAAARVAVFAPIGGDHHDLGSDRVALARTKLGIVTHGGRTPDPVLVSARQAPDVAGLFARVACARGLTLDTVGTATRLLTAADHPEGQRLVLASGPRRHRVDLPLHGRHQADNALLALAAVEAFLQRPVDEATVRSGLGRSTSPGRGELCWAGTTPVWLDGAHNPVAAASLAATLPRSRRRVLVVGCAASKDLAGMVQALGPVVDDVVATTLPSPGSTPATEVATAVRRAGLTVTEVQDPAAALGTALERAGDIGEVVVTGSLHLVGMIRGQLDDVVVRRPAAQAPFVDQPEDARVTVPA